MLYKIYQKDIEKGVAETYALKVKVALGAILRFISPLYYII